MFDRLAVGRQVAAGARRIEVGPPYGDGIEAEGARDLVHDRLGADHPLRTAEAPEGGVRRGVRLAGQAAQTDVRVIVGVVGMAQGARDHRRRQIHRPAAIGGEIHVDGPHAAVALDASLPAQQERMALAGNDHVGVAVQTQLYRTFRRARQHGRDAGDQGRLAFLAAEGAAHAPHRHL